MKKLKVIAGVTESDSHVVANHLLCRYLETKGYQVINLGACTPMREFAEAFEFHSDAVAMVIGSLNGHAFDDLKPLLTENLRPRIQCPIIVGGNLSVGSIKNEDDLVRLRSLGVDNILGSYELLPELIESYLTIPQRSVV